MHSRFQTSVHQQASSQATSGRLTVSGSKALWIFGSLIYIIWPCIDFIYRWRVLNEMIEQDTLSKPSTHKDTCTIIRHGYTHNITEYSVTKCLLTINAALKPLLVQWLRNHFLRYLWNVVTAFCRSHLISKHICTVFVILCYHHRDITVCKLLYGYHILLWCSLLDSK